MTQGPQPTSNSPDRRDIVILVLTPVVSAVVGRAFDLSPLAVAAIVVSSSGALAAWFAARWMAHHRSLREKVATLEIEVKRIRADNARLSRKQQGDSQALKRRIDLATAAAVPPWLLAAMSYAQERGWSVEVLGTSVRFEHDWYGPISLSFPLEDLDACRDELFDHLGSQASRFLTRILDAKQIGGDR
jgi:hypothetical protein